MAGSEQIRASMAPLVSNEECYIDYYANFYASSETGEKLSRYTQEWTPKSIMSDIPDNYIACIMAYYSTLDKCKACLESTTYTAMKELSEIAFHFEVEPTKMKEVRKCITNAGDYACDRLEFIPHQMCNFEAPQATIKDKRELDYSLEGKESKEFTSSPSSHVDSSNHVSHRKSFNELWPYRYYRARTVRKARMLGTFCSRA